jgi:hypothetical protein
MVDAGIDEHFGEGEHTEVLAPLILSHNFLAGFYVNGNLS